MKEELIKCQRELESMKEAYSQMLGLKELYKARLARLQARMDVYEQPSDVDEVKF